MHFFLHLEPRQGDLVYERLKACGYRSYKEWLQKLMFGLGQKIAVRLQDGEEIAPLTYRMQRTFGHGDGATRVITTTAELAELEADSEVLIFDVRMDAERLWT